MQPEDPMAGVLSLEAWRERMSPVTWGHRPRTPEQLDASYRQTLNETREFRERGVIRPGDFVVDIGSGNGRMAAMLEAIPIGRYLGIDPHRRSVEFCRELMAHNPRFAFEWTDLRNGQYNPKGKVKPHRFSIGLPDGSVDAVICCSLFTHIETEKAAKRYLREIARVLKPGGRCFSSWFRSPPNPPTSDPLRTVFREARIRRLFRPFDIVHERGGTTTEFNDQWCIFARKTC